MCASMYAGLGQALCCADITRPGLSAGVGWDFGMSALGLILFGTSMLVGLVPTRDIKLCTAHI